MTSNGTDHGLVFFCTEAAMTRKDNHEQHMEKAIALARLGLGRTAPNPCVGAVLVRDGQVVARGWHERFGGPHAEVNAIAHAHARGIDPAGCTLYVTLEPCAHHGKTPPCTDAILAAGIRHVVVGTRDPNLRAAGGVERLRAAGVEVLVGVLEERCQDLIADFRLWQTTDRPYVFLKLAQTLDGKIALRPGERTSISGHRAGRLVHRLRSRVGAILVGGGTFRADNPRLTCRHPRHTGPQPLAAVATRTLPEADAPLVLLRETPERTVFLTSAAEARSRRATLLMDLGCQVYGLPETSNGLDLVAGLTLLRRLHGCTYVLAEGGGTLAASLLAAAVVDELLLFLSPCVLGDVAAPASFQGRHVRSMADALPLRLTAVRHLSPDILLTFRPRLCSPASSNPSAQ